VAGGSAENSGDGQATATSPYYQLPIDGDSIHQGEILRDVCEWVPVYGDNNRVKKAIPRRNSLAVVVTQECDLAQDFLKRQAEPMIETDLRSVLLCPAKNPVELRKPAGDVGSDLWNQIRQNKSERYHYLAGMAPGDVIDGQERDPIVVDFKSFFTVRTVELYRQLGTPDEESAARLSLLRCPWREHLQDRFGNYLTRVGLPQDHFIPESRRNPLTAGAT